ncbi:hypothetical protein DL89DRAFT_323256 [Linderina pennispora]|uniref:Uncharacterized protein n=1 Tax=Linderina pennispora TaxID=61395 RepID=A0A1Y1W6F6_9FUNG|nr:uncharacterized protein DL89DRAFT_323256 [Linderina pennispora]ORX69109.1 hypothetical protein DL89DRAFT_323256 [Linderina pennispora]
MSNEMQVAPDDSWLAVVGKGTFTKRNKSQHLLALFKADENSQLVSAGLGLPDVYSFMPNNTGVILYVTVDFGRKIQQLKMHRFGDEHLSNAEQSEEYLIQLDFDYWPSRENWEETTELQGMWLRRIIGLEDYLAAATWPEMEVPFGGLCGLHHLSNTPDLKNKGILHMGLSTHLQEYVVHTALEHVAKFR